MNLDGGVLTFNGKTRPPYNLSADFNPFAGRADTEIGKVFRESEFLVDYMYDCIMYRYVFVFQTSSFEIRQKLLLQYVRIRKSLF